MALVEALSRKSAPQGVLTIDEIPTTGIVHIGLGNFHRAHFAIYTADAVAKSGGDWGIFAYSMRSKRIAKDMANQDLLYSVVTISPDISRVQIPGIHSGVASGPEEVGKVIEEIAAHHTKIISLTVTEAGYNISQATGGLDSNSADIQSDLEGNPPKTAVGLIVRGLQRRSLDHNLPITVLSCDNLSHNGDKTAALVREFVAALAEPESAPLAQYIANYVSFPNSMVDRIVPGTEAKHLEQASSALGLVDLTPVPAEPFGMWIIEDDFKAGRPAWENAGATFSDEVDKYEIMKLRLLNGGHSLIAYLGGLNQSPTIPDSRFTPHIEAALRQILFKEFLPSLTMPQGVSAEEYIGALFSRWSNTVLGDRTSRVGSDGSTKLPQRITEVVISQHALGEVPKFVALTVASWLACVAPLAGFNPGAVAAEMKDPHKEWLVDLAGRSESAEDFVNKIFASEKIFAAEVASARPFLNEVARLLQSIMDIGAKSTTENLITSE